MLLSLLKVIELHTTLNEKILAILNSLYHAGGQLPPTNLAVLQDSFDSVQVSWTAPPGRRYYVTADPGGISVETRASPLLGLLLQQPGVYDIRVATSQHLPGGTAGPVEVTVRGDNYAV